MEALFTVPTDTFTMEVESKRCNNEKKKSCLGWLFLFYFSIFMLGADRIQSYLEGRHILPHRYAHSWKCWIPRWIWNNVRAGETQEISHLDSKILLLEYSCGYFNLEMNRRRSNHDSYCEISNAQRKHSKISRKKCNGKIIQQVRVVVFFQRTWVQFQYPHGGSQPPVTLVL